ncbi:MAG: hypothetical protein QNJ72_43680 [Pleurocapsa sp. MO_226.B13]|nr:hypothetical protein [Pleurocapsa sp. MO_226.B13]
MDNNLSLIISLIVFTSLPKSVATANVELTILFQPPLEEAQPENTEGAASR